MQVHFIAIGGSAMHNLAIALSRKNDTITGSDDEIFEPSRSRLARSGLLPPAEGWFPEKIHRGLDAVILGMHAKPDNPELLRARELDLKIFSYPEYLYEQSKEKIRVVIGGSHGKTTITAMILHVLKSVGMDCDYMVGAQLDGFDIMVKLSDTAPVMIMEGDEYLTSPIDRRPKFHLYHPDIALLSGIAWDHINVFPTFEQYVEQFTGFIRLITPGGTLIYFDEDETLHSISRESRNDISLIPYTTHPYRIERGVTYLITRYGTCPLELFGRHNLANLNGARMVCNHLGVPDQPFYESITSFRGASKRLELLTRQGSFSLFKDFAHAPSKVKATIEAVRAQHPGRNFIACLELHTFSSLSAGFLPQYAETMEQADLAIVYFNPHALRLKQLPTITAGEIKSGFGRPDLEVFDDSGKLRERLLSIQKKNTVFLLMSSGNFDGINLQELAG